MCPVKLALVVTVPAVKPAAVPVQFVSTPEAGVPRRGAVKVGDPVQLVITPEAGVPRAGVTKTGEVLNTAKPEPVSSDIAAASWALLKTPSTAALPEEVMCPVKLALVVTAPAVNPGAVPEQ